MKNNKKFDYCVLAERIFPYSNDPTAFVVGRFVNALKDKSQSIIVCSKAVQLKKIHIKRIDNVTYVLIRDNQIDYRNFSSLTKEKNWLIRALLFVSFFFSKTLFKLNKRKKTITYLKRIKKSIKNFEIKNLALFCGNFYLCDLINDFNIRFDKKILFATDYWKFFYDDKTFESFSFDKLFLPESISYKNERNVEQSEWKPFFDNLSLSMISTSRVPLRCCFFGTLNRARDYIKFLDLINCFTNLCVHVYSDLRDEICNKYSNIKFHKMVFGQDFIQELSATDVFVILDNNQQFRQWIPSKIYEAMSTGKPIIFISDTETSPSWKILSKYPLAYFVNLNEDKTAAIKKMTDIIKLNSMKISCKKLFDIYPDCDASYFIENIL